MKTEREGEKEDETLTAYRQHRWSENGNGPYQANDYANLPWNDAVRENGNGIYKRACVAKRQVDKQVIEKMRMQCRLCGTRRSGASQTTM